MIGVNKMVYSIENDSLYVSVELKGAQLKSIYSKDSKIEYLWQGDSAFWAGRAYNLFPYVGRLAGGKYVVEGKEYAMDRHGFARGMQFCLTEKSDNSMTFAICSTEETKKIYPFDFILKVTFTILGKKLTVSYDVKNVGKNVMYFCLGGHPGFALGGFGYPQSLCSHAVTNSGLAEIDAGRPDLDAFSEIETHSHTSFFCGVKKSSDTAIIGTQLPEVKKRATEI